MSGKFVAVAGATGVVGRQMLLTLEARNFPVSRIKCLARAFQGRTVPFKGEEIPVEVLSEDSFEGVDIALLARAAARARSSPRPRHAPAR